MEVPLYGANRPAKGLSEGLHLWPAQACLVVSVVGEAAVGGDRFGRDAGLYEVKDLGYTGKFGLRWHTASSLWCGGCALAILDDKIHQSGESGLMDYLAAFS